MRHIAIVLMVGLYACGQDDGSGATYSTSSSQTVCDPGALYVCTCADGRESQRACRASGQGWEGCDCGTGGSTVTGQGGGAGGGAGGAGAAGGSGGAWVPECQADADCEVVLAEALAECSLPFPQCRVECIAVISTCALYGPYRCNAENPCAPAPICNQVTCVSQGNSSSCVYSPVPDGTACTPGGMALCVGGVCDP